jgi:lipoprotein-anchoring transpeptidase ErfK/SrfK
MAFSARHEKHPDGNEVASAGVGIAPDEGQRSSEAPPLKTALRICSVIAICAFATACTTSGSTYSLSANVSQRAPQKIDYSYAYASVEDDEIVLPEFDYTQMRDKYLRQEVKYRGREPAGSIVIDTTGPYLYYVLGARRAIRYGIAVGREGFEWDGDTVINSKQHWPTWTPPAEMIARTPSLKEFENGMPAGVENPLGARAMYLFKDGKDTMYRIHGSNRPFSIGKNASSGCFRMINQDVIDLYARVSPGTKVKVRHGLPEHDLGGV